MTRNECGDNRFDKPAHWAGELALVKAVVVLKQSQAILGILAPQTQNQIHNQLAALCRLFDIRQPTREPLLARRSSKGSFNMADCGKSPVDEASLWLGEVLELDERNGYLFISLANPENPPVLGSFLVRPFDFLGMIDTIYIW